MAIPARKAIVRHWATSGEVGAVDVGEPACFACNSIRNKWADLERAHIVPRSLGGSDMPSNLLMLCASCHADSPDCSDRRYMMRWISQRPKCHVGLAWGAHDIARELNLIGFELIPADLDIDGFRKFLTGFAGTHGARISASTAAAAIVAFATKEKQ